MFYDKLNTRIVIFQACVLFYIQIHVLYIYYIIELIIDWILTCWRSNWLKISNKIIQIILLFIPRPILRLFPHHKLQQTKLLLDVVVDESCIGFLIQKLITSNLFVSLSLSLSRPTKSSFQRERFSFFFPPYDSNKVKWTEDDRRGTRDDLVRPKISRQLSEATLSILPEWP